MIRAWRAVMGCPQTTMTIETPILPLAARECNAGARRPAQQVGNGRVGRWSMAGLPTSGVCPFVPFFPCQTISPDLSCTISSQETRYDLS